MTGFFYLNKRKQFMFTERRPPESAVKKWVFDDEATTTGTLCRIAIEVVALGADADNVARLLERWKFDSNTLVGFAERCGVRLERAGGGRGSYAGWIASFQRFPKGVPPQIKYGSGTTPLKAMANLAESGVYLQNQKELTAVIQ